MVSKLFRHLKSMLTFTLTSAKPLEWIKSHIHSRPITRFPFCFFLSQCWIIERDTHPRMVQRLIKQRSVETGENLLSVVSGKCRTTLTSFNWRWQCSTVLICQGQETPRYCSLLREQEADGGGLKNPYPLPSTSQLQQMAPRMPSVKCFFSSSMWSHVSTLGIQL